MSEQKLMLRLYIMGNTANSKRALTNIQKLLDEERSGPRELEIINILTQPELANEDGIIAIPTLLKRQPPPVRRIIGDLSDRGKVLSELGIIPRNQDAFPETRTRKSPIAKSPRPRYTTPTHGGLS